VHHRAVGQPCPIDGTPVERRHCSACTHFVSFRSSDGIDTIGCTWGQDMSAWLRTEMSTDSASGRGSRLTGTSQRALPARSSFRPAPPRPPAGAIRTPIRASGGGRLAMLACAIGLGLFLSALDRPSSTDSTHRTR
jgi:hypothetical protein